MSFNTCMLIIVDSKIPTGSFMKRKGIKETTKY